MIRILSVEEFETIIRDVFPPSETNQDNVHQQPNINNDPNLVQASPTGISPAQHSSPQEPLNGRIDEENSSEDKSILIFLVSQAAALHDSDRLQVIAQPTYGTKLRYRSDYDKNENRLGVLKNKTINSSYQGPAIRVGIEFIARQSI